VAVIQVDIPAPEIDGESDPESPGSGYVTEVGVAGDRFVIVARMLRARPDERYPDYASLLADLDEAERELRARAGEPPPRAQEGPARRRVLPSRARDAKVLALVAAVVMMGVCGALGGLLWWIYAPRDGPEGPTVPGWRIWPGRAGPEASPERTPPNDIPPGLVYQSSGGEVVLTADRAVLYGQDEDPETPGLERREVEGTACLGNWSSPSEWVGWEFDLTAPGPFRVALTYAASDGQDGGEYFLTIDDQELAGRVTSTGSASRFARLEVGSVALLRPGRHMLAVRPALVKGEHLMNLKSVTLSPFTTTAPASSPSSASAATSRAAAEP